ncbi:MAG: hypothetical protein RJA44_2173 [Pseudomonadota bacterium]|jgi:diguanylate cyclase (GGDEF)-like protein
MPVEPSHLLAVLLLQMVLYTVMWGAAWSLLDEARDAVLHWFGFALLLSIGLGLMCLRPDGPPWLTQVWSNIFCMSAFVALRRGAALFAGLEPHKREFDHAWLGLGLCLALLLIGPEPEQIGARGLLLLISLCWIFLRMTVELYPPLRRQFGRRVALAAVLPSALFGLLNLLRLVIGLSLGYQQLKVSQVEGFSHLLIYGGVVVAALFNFLFLFLVVIRLRQRLVFLAEHDPLTGLLNRRAMQRQLDRAWQRHRRGDGGFALVSVDLDHFKRINDEHGHAVGDHVLVHLAELLRRQARSGDRLARMGGEEFLLLLPGADAQGSVQVARRVQEQLSARAVPIGEGRSIGVSASLGVAVPIPGDTHVDVVLRRSDAALYLAKRSGRDRVVTQEELLARGSPNLPPTTI